MLQALRDVEEINKFFINFEHNLLRSRDVTIESEELQTMLREHTVSLTLTLALVLSNILPLIVLLVNVLGKVAHISVCGV